MAHYERAGAGFLAPYLPPFPTDRTLTQRWHFESLAALADYAPKTAPEGAFSPATFGGDVKWHGATVAEAHRLAHQGWPEGAARARAIAERIALDAPTLPRVARWDVAGSVASVPRHLGGNPLAMRRITADASRRKPVVTLIAQVGASNKTETPQYTQATACAVAVVDRMEAAGFRVEIIGVWRAGSNDRPVPGPFRDTMRQHEVAFIAKRAEDPLDLEALAFSLGHVSLSRRIIFAAIQRGLPTKTREAYLLGVAIDLAADPDRPDASFCLPNAARYTGQSDRGGDLAAFRMTCDQLRRQGCPGIPEDLSAVA